jgi:hypothetical protein
MTQKHAFLRNEPDWKTGKHDSKYLSYSYLRKWMWEFESGSFGEAESI